MILSRIRIAAIAFLFTAGTVTGVYWYGYFKGKAKAKIEVRYETVEKIVKVRKEQDVIRNNRPDDASLYNSLHTGSF